MLSTGGRKPKGNKTSVRSYKPARALVGITHRAESGLLILQRRWQPWCSGHGVKGGLRGLKRPWQGVPYAEGNILMESPTVRQHPGGNAHAGAGGGPGGGASSRCRNAEGTPQPCVLPDGAWRALSWRLLQTRNCGALCQSSHPPHSLSHRLQHDRTKSDKSRSDQLRSVDWSQDHSDTTK